VPRCFTKRLVKDERGYFGLSPVSDVQEMEIIPRMTKSHKEGGMGLADELRKVVPQVFMSWRIGTIAVSLFSAGLWWGLSY
jgi:hypothetical protein